MADNDEPMIQTPSDFGHFLLEKELGHGGMGGVYLARDKMLDRRVGIKVMLKSLGADPKFVERFQREAQAAARLNHPNIAQIYSFGQEQGMPYIAMELVSGGSLDKEMEANPGTMDVVHVMRVGQQVADALALAAESGLVHGDVKPENVLFDADGNAKLVDFGLAAMQGDSDEIWGTPYYISPEKVRRQKIDYRADIYSLGGTLYHVLTGVPPFDGPDPTAVVKARFEAPPKKPSEIRPEIPPEVDSIIMRMLELEPSMRYPTYQSLLGDFKRYLAKAGPVKTTKTSGPKLKFKGMKPKVTLSSTGKTASQGLADGDIADLTPVADLDGQEEEKKHMSVGMMVGLVVGGVVLVILLVAGGLWWYVSSSQSASEEQNVQLIVDKQNQAKASINKTVQAIKKDYEDFHELVKKGDAAVSQALKEVGKAIPEKMRPLAAGLLAEPPSPEIAAAVDYTNKLFAVVAPQQPPAADKAEGTNAVDKVSAEKKAAEGEDAKKGDGAKKSDEKGDGAKKSDEKKSKDKKADTKKDVKKGGKKANAKKEAEEEDKDAEAEQAQDEAEAKAEGKKPAKKGDAAKKEDKDDGEEEKPAAEEGKPAAEEEKKDEEPPAEGDAKPAEEEKPALELPLTVQNSLKQSQKLWEAVHLSKAADIVFHGNMRKLLAMADGAAGMTAQDEETTTKLAKLANDLVDMYNGIKSEKSLMEAKRKLRDLIDKRAGNYQKETIEKINKALEKIARAERAKQEAEEKAKKAAEAAEALKAKIEEEKQAAQTAFDGLERDIKRIDWLRCTRELTGVRDKMTTDEGRDAVSDQLQKIKAMEGMQKHFIKHAKGVAFKTRGGVLLALVTKTDDKSLTLLESKRDSKGKLVLDKSRKPVPGREKRVDWDRFYGLKEKEYLGYMNHMINELIMKGRDNTRIGPLEWSNHMLGAALTLQHLYGDQKGVDKFIPVLVKKAVKDFEPSRKWAVKWFPDVELEEPVE